MANKQRDIPMPVIERLPRYFAHLRHLRQYHRKTVLSHNIARALGLTSSTVRQDFSHLDCRGMFGQGYKIEDLEKTIADVLGLNVDKKIIAVGSGVTDRGLSLNETLADNGFTMCGFFSLDSKSIGKKTGELTIQDINALPEVVKENQVDIGIVAVKPCAAQGVIDKMILSGISGILNLTSANVCAPQRISILNAGVTINLQLLSCLMKECLRE